VDSFCSDFVSFDPESWEQLLDGSGSHEKEKVSILLLADFSYEIKKFPYWKIFPAAFTASQNKIPDLLTARVQAGILRRIQPSAKHKQELERAFQIRNCRVFPHRPTEKRDEY